MPYFDRFDICEAHLVIEMHWHHDGWLSDRPSNRRRKEATDVQLTRIGFKPSPLLDFDHLSENGKDIYVDLCERYGFADDDDAKTWIQQRNERYHDLGFDDDPEEAT